MLIYDAQTYIRVIYQLIFLLKTNYDKIMNFSFNLIHTISINYNIINY